MMRPSLAAVLVCAALTAGALLFAQKDPSAEQQQRRAAELAKAPDSARSRRNPLEKDPDAVAAGRKLFEQRCAECHGADAGGGRKGPSLRQDEVQSVPAGVLFWFVTNGNVRHGMPPWSKLPDPQRWQLVGFLKSLGTDGNRIPR
jgi:mono/diheme cytochrome c family protein